MPAAKVLGGIRQSLWFVPTTWVLFSVVAAFGMVAIDSATPELARHLPLVFGGGPEGARGLLSAIAGSMITVAGVVFSVTTVALQLTSSQYSPRVLRTFLRDRPSQLVLGSFLGTFTYAVLVLRTIRTEDGGQAAFVPALGVTGAIILSLVAIGMLVYFIHHIGSLLQVSEISASITHEILAELERQDGDTDGRATDRTRSGRSVTPTTAPDRVIEADGSGYLQYVEVDGFVQLARRADLLLRMNARPGQWVNRHDDLVAVWGAEPPDSLADEVRDLYTLGPERVVFQDPTFGVRQLADIAVRALSPGMNDPTTAVHCVHRLSQVLIVAGRTHLIAEAHPDDDGAVRLLLPRVSFNEMVETAFGEIIHFGRELPRIDREVAAALDSICRVVPAQHAPAISRMRARLPAVEPAGGDTSIG